MGDAMGQDSSPEWDGGEADRLRCLNDMLLNRPRLGLPPPRLAVEARARRTLWEWVHCPPRRRAGEPTLGGSRGTAATGPRHAAGGREGERERERVEAVNEGRTGDLGFQRVGYGPCLDLAY